jgi:hypothetical protein
MKCGWIVEGFYILPSISITWMTTNWVQTGKFKRIYDIQFAWLFWYIQTDNIGKELKKRGY